MGRPFVTKRTIRAGGSYAIGTIVDEYLTEDQNAALYEKWQPGWPEPLAFSGGLKAITCEMILEVPQEDFTKFIGKKVAPQILEIAARNAGR